MRQTMPTRLAGRIYAVMILIGFCFFILSAQMMRWQAMTASAATDTTASRPQEEQPVARGNIVDRNGYLLAGDAHDWEISASPKDMGKRKPQVAEELARLLGKPPETMLEKLTPNVPYVLLERRAPAEVGETIAAWDAMTVTAKPVPRRMYPQQLLGAHLMGFVNEQQRGFYGLEGYYQDYLTATNPRLPAADLSISENEPLPTTPEMVQNLPSPAGHDLVLTIDRSVQWMIEQELLEGIKQHQAESGTIIVMEPRSGAILGMASYPTYDPNRYAVTNNRLFEDPSTLR